MHALRTLGGVVEQARHLGRGEIEAAAAALPSRSVPSGPRLSRGRSIASPAALAAGRRLARRSQRQVSRFVPQRVAVIRERPSLASSLAIPFSAASRVSR